jgi:hypothetical protein
MPAKEPAHDAKSTPTSAERDGETSKDANQHDLLPPRPLTFIERLAKIPVLPENNQESILVRPMMRYPSQRETKVHAYKVHQDLKAQELHDELQKVTRARLPDWRKLLGDMMLATPLYLNGVVEVHIPPQQAHLFLGFGKDGSLLSDIRLRTGSYMELESRPRQDGSAVLRISGPRSAIDQAVTDIVKMTKAVKVILLDTSAETVLHNGLAIEGPAKVNATEGLSSSPAAQVDEGANVKASAKGDDRQSILPVSSITVPHTRHSVMPRQPIYFKTKASGVTKPAFWTRKSFEEYVYTLTHGIMPNSLAGRLYPEGVTHREEVTKQLHRIFNDPATREAQSPHAFKIALKYMARQGPGSRPDTRALFVRMESMGMDMDTSVFNILAADCVNQRDLRNFASCIYLMLQRGLEPNFRTWLLFLKLIENEQVKRYILQVMHSRNLLSDPRHLAIVALIMAPYDAERAVRQGWHLAPFLSSQEKLYGRNWLSHHVSHRTLDRVLDVLLKHSQFPGAEELIDYMIRHPTLKPNVVTLNIYLHHAKNQKKVRQAVDMVSKLGKHKIIPDSISLDHLFTLFRQMDRAHCLDVIWQYSLLTAKTQYHMRNRIGGLFHKGFQDNWHIGLPEIQSLSKAEQVEAATFTLLLSTAKRMLQSPIDTDRDLVKKLVGQAHMMRSEGWVPTAGGLGEALSEAMERDFRFREGLSKGEWVVEGVSVSAKKGLASKEWSAEQEQKLLEDAAADERKVKRGLEEVEVMDAVEI